MRNTKILAHMHDVEDAGRFDSIDSTIHIRVMNYTKKYVVL